MGNRFTRLAIIFFGELIERIASADNCGSLNDCYSTVQSANGVGVSIAVIVTIGMILDFFRGEGEVKTSPEVRTIDKIGGVPGYPESGEETWRSSNDADFKRAVDQYNNKYNLKVGDQGHWTPERLKAQAMIESGGSKAAFLSDPLQVNVHGDWVDEKKEILGIERNQVMTPEISASAALEWLRYKGWQRNDKGEPIKYKGDSRTLRDYNGNKNEYPGHPGVEHRDWYSNKIVELEQKMKQSGGK